MDEGVEARTESEDGWTTWIDGPTVHLDGPPGSVCPRMEGLPPWMGRPPWRI